MLYLASLSFVPYDINQWKYLWNSIMTTIGSASKVGMIVFAAVICISIFKRVLSYWFSA